MISLDGYDYDIRIEYRIDLNSFIFCNIMNIMTDVFQCQMLSSHVEEDGDLSFLP